ncbi:MAG: c-type cytochrome [Pirellulaceae bacterium]|nr:c-type cytochrome [Pirellulaceae bacterium]
MSIDSPFRCLPRVCELVVAMALCGAIAGNLDDTSHAFAQRVPWMSSRVIGSPDPPKEYHVERVYPNLEFIHPVEMMPLGNTGRMMVLQVDGQLLTFNDDPACEQTDLALDLSQLIDRHRRSLGFVLHPDFDNNRQLFVVYCRDPAATPDGTRLSRFTVTLSDSDPPTVDPQSEEVLLTWASGGHNGCALRFDADGLLYFSAGDGARPFPPDEYNVSQDLSDLRSTICRINVDQPSEDRLYSIPADNPFVDTAGARPEIWAYGFRNPWRYDFVPGTNRILCGDVGWELWEMVFDVRRGGNYGWSLYEGPQRIRNDVTIGPTPIEKPLISYPHTQGQSITGGVVYQGAALPELKDVYLYGDYVTGLLWGVRTDDPHVTWNPVLAETGLQIISFAKSASGEPLILDYAGGVYRLIQNPETQSDNRFPRMLSETGLFASTETLEPASGVYNYDITAQAYQEGATAEFVVAVPGTESIKIQSQKRRWTFPKGTVFAKTLSHRLKARGEIQSKRIETQLLHFDGMKWQPYSYLWNDSQSDAELVDAAGVSLPVEAFDSQGVAMKQWWVVSARSECRVCHTPQTGGAVGFSLENLAPGQVEAFTNLGIFDRKAPANWNITAMVDPADESSDLDLRARSYLMANCAHCHRRGGGGTVPLDLVYSNSGDHLNAVNVPAMQGDFGIKHAKVIAPGNPYRSILYYRMATSGAGHMPKRWTRENDALGLRIVHDWIDAMEMSTQSGREATADLGEVSAALKQFADVINDPNDDNLQAARKLGLSNSNPLVADLFERFVPVAERRQRLGKNIDTAAILSINGDVQQGQDRMFARGSQQCLQCHRVKGIGTSIGPDLDGIGSKRTREQLLESIVEPSKLIDPKYAAHIVLDVNGAITIGLKISEDDQAVVLRSADGKIHRLRHGQIEARQDAKKSLMPDSLAEYMTADELADMLAFLKSLQ